MHEWHGGAIGNVLKEQYVINSSILLDVAAGHVQIPHPKRLLGPLKHDWWIGLSNN